MKYCGNCGKKIPDEGRYCTYCGEKALTANNQSEDGAILHNITETFDEDVPNQIEKESALSVVKYGNRTFKITPIVVVTIILLLMVLSTFYNLYQINRYEQALAGKIYLKQPSSFDFQKYEDAKKEYSKLSENYIENNPKLIEMIASYQKIKTPEPKKSDNSGANRGSDGQAKGYYSQEDAINGIIASAFSRNFLPNELKLTYEQVLLFKQEHPQESEISYQICNDLIARNPWAPRPSNPPKKEIEQSIQEYHRNLYAFDGLLMISLIAFLVLYKDVDKRK